MQAARWPDYPTLNALAGFRYCDLLLAAAERAAWLEVSKQKAEAAGQKSELVETCRAVVERAGQTLKWAESFTGAPLLDFALNHLTLSRAALYMAILSNSKLETRNSFRPWTASAVPPRKTTSPAASLPVPGCALSPARALALRARRPTWMRRGRSPSGGRCGCIWRTFIYIARGCSEG